MPTVVLAALLGIGTYLSIKAEGSMAELLWVAILLASIVAAATIGRWRLLASLAGPFLALVGLESQGYIGNDGVQPLGFVMLFTNLFWPALALLVGLGLHQVVDVIRAATGRSARSGSRPGP